MKPQVLLLGAITLLFTGCRKLYDAIHQYDSKTNCSINTVTDYIAGHSSVTPRVATVNYNSDGNPVSVTYDKRETGYGWAFLKYDKYKRLIELKEENNALRTYVYNGMDAQPVRDTALSYNTTAKFVEYFTYDNKGRIIKVKGKFISAEFGDPSPGYEENYSYDAHGNLVAPVTYDNKISVYRTHPVWMFIFKNYSMNNQGLAVSYTAKGLPLDFTGSGGPSMRFFEGNFSGAQITYNCD